MTKPTIDKTRRLMTLGLISAGAMAPSAARAQFRLPLKELSDIKKTIDTIDDVANLIEQMSIDEDAELAMGESLYGPLIADAGGAYRNSAVQSAVERIAAPIFELSERPRFTWEITVLDSNEVNAWCLPGGKVAVCKGLLRYAASEDELAAVLSHEFAHAELSHVKSEMKQKAFYQGMSDAATTAAVKAIDDNTVDQVIVGLKGPMYQLVTSGYSKGSENEADQYIITVFDNLGRDVHSGVGFFHTLLELVPSKSKRKTSLFSGHPETKKRIKRITDAAPAEGPQSPADSDDFGRIKTVFPTRRHYMRERAG